ncbi:hypothetical protein UFOVP783_86 [uncultured Caudovirales phage]|uniref:Uncharacterized protein n=1 Tax=uncultured Caudovirales phage TaxID=2100421 RepID=A0A6J5NUJ3_9CAUD|nr:hypothetical protein UFOVP783_86 [uncultured Caudovirales phage]
MPLPIKRAPSRAPAKTVSAGVSGSAALRAAEEEERKQQARREQGRLPFRFWLPKGESRGMILLDEWFIAPDEDAANGSVLITEHDLPDPQNGNKRTLREICLASVGQPCPYCQAGERSSRRFVLTVYEVGEWTNQRTGVTHPGSRRLLAFPVGMRSIFLQLQQAAERGGHTMRGMYLHMERGTDEKSASVGEPVMLENNQLFEMLDWDQIEAAYGNEPLMSTTQPGKVVKPANEDLTPVDYAKAFAVPVIETSSAAPRGGVPRALPGSKQEQEQALAEDDEDPIPMEHDTDPEPPAAPARARTPMRQAAPAAAPARAAAPTARAGAAPAARPAASPARTAARQAPAPAAGPARRRTATQPAADPFDD